MATHAAFIGTLNAAKSGNGAEVILNITAYSNQGTTQAILGTAYGATGKLLLEPESVGKNFMFVGTLETTSTSEFLLKVDRAEDPANPTFIWAVTSGNLGRDAEQKQGKSPFTVFGVATKTDKKETQWVDVTANGKVGEVLLQYGKKGTNLLVAGSVSANTYNNVTKLRLNLSKFEFGSKGSSSEGNQSKATTGKPSSPQPSDDWSNVKVDDSIFNV